MQQKYNDDCGDIFDAAVPDDSNMYSRDMDEVKNLVAREEIAESSAPYMAYVT